ncbi:MAG TPA: hypothetical protein VD828_00660 [Candidatus Nitrosotenuis sp.]|nr:hypothetical protein [Candidatus Nitrosotenuis sp.]
MNTTKLVFSNYGYVGLAAAVFVVMFFLLSALSEYVFFEPYFVFYVPDDRALGFTLILAVSVLSAVVIPMNVYRVKMSQRISKASGGFLGSLIGASAGACSCGPVGFAIISTFGTAGGIATAFLASYEIPLRIISTGILGFVYYTTSKSLSSECKVR